MGIVSVLCPKPAGWRLHVVVSGEGFRFLYLSKMHLIEDYLIGMPNAPESSDESQ